MQLTPFHRAPYTQLEKKRSSIGEDLLYTDGCHGDSLMAEERTSTILPPLPTTHPSPAAAASITSAAPSHPSLPPLASIKLPNPRLSPLQVSPLFLTFLQSPTPTASIPHRRSSQDSLLSTESAGNSGLFAPSLLLPSTTHNNNNNGTRRSSQDSLGSGVSLASSGIFSPSLLSWPMPPPSSSSREASVAASPPTTRASMRKSLEGLAARYKPLTPIRVAPPPLSVMPPVEAMPALPMPALPAQVAGTGREGGLFG